MTSEPSNPLRSPETPRFFINLFPFRSRPKLIVGSLDGNIGCRDLSGRRPKVFKLGSVEVHGLFFKGSAGPSADRPQFQS